MPEPPVEPIAPEATPGPEIKADPPPAPAPDAPAPPSLGERLNKATKAELKEWEDTGKEPAEAAKATIQPEPAPGQQEPKHLSVEERSERDSRRSGARQRDYFQRKLAEERTKREALERQIADKPPEAAPGTTVKPPVDGEPDLVLPDINDFDTTADYNKAVAKVVKDNARKTAQFVLQQERDAQTRSDQDQEREERHSELDTSWKERETEFSKASPDYLTAKTEIGTFFGKFPEGHPSRELESAIVEMENPALIYHLWKNPAEFQRILGLSTRRGIAEMGALSVKLDTPKAPQPKKHTNATEPVASIGGRAATTDGPKIGSPEWERQENAKDIERRQHSWR